MHCCYLVQTQCLLTSPLRMFTQQPFMHSLIQKLDHAMAHGINFHFLYDGDGNCGKGGINDYPADLELQNKVKGFVMENNGVKKQLLGG